MGKTTKKSVTVTAKAKVSAKFDPHAGLFYLIAQYFSEQAKRHPDGHPDAENCKKIAKAAAVCVKENGGMDAVGVPGLERERIGTPKGGKSLRRSIAHAKVPDPILPSDAPDDSEE